MDKREILIQRLKAPFQASELEFRPGSTRKSGKEAKPVGYVDTRAVNQRLGRVLGVGNYDVKLPILIMGEDTYGAYTWENGQKKKVGENKGLLVGCSVSIEVHHPELKMVVSNVGEKSLDESGYNKCTSAYAQAFKRAAGQLGVGEYIYNLDLDWTSCNNGSLGEYTAPDDAIEDALIKAGFESKCEVTGQKVPWKWAARSMRYYGMVLCEEEQKKLLGK